MPKKIISFGYRHGIPEDLDEGLMLDIRTIVTRNPFHIRELRKLRGDHPKVIKYMEDGSGIEGNTNLDTIYNSIKEMVVKCKGNFYIGCTGGHHRSVYIANRLGKDLDCEVIHLNYDNK